MKDWTGEQMFFGGLIVFLLSLVVGCTAYNIHTNNRKAEALASGTDPIAVMCLYDFSEQKRETCNIYVTKKGSN